MKRMVSLLLVCLLPVMLLGGCAADKITMFDGDFIMQGTVEEDVDVPTMLLDTELSEFLLSPGDYGDFADYGTYVIDGDHLIATSRGNVYTFRIVNGALMVYEGAETTQFIDIPVGSEFLMETEAPPLSGSVAAACVH